MKVLPLCRSVSVGRFKNGDASPLVLFLHQNIFCGYMYVQALS